MDIKKLTSGKKVNFSLDGKILNCTYFGKFDFLYCFDTSVKILPQVTVLNKRTKSATSIVLINFNLLQSYGLSLDEIKAILYHEEGHILSTGQQTKAGLDLEFDADDYALPFVGASTLISALKKTKNIIINESTDKETIPEKLENLAKRIEKISMRAKSSDIEK